MFENQTEFEALCTECDKHYVLKKEEMIYNEDYLRYKAYGYVPTICKDCLTKI